MFTKKSFGFSKKSAIIEPKRGIAGKVTETPPVKMPPKLQQNIKSNKSIPSPSKIADKSCSTSMKCPDCGQTLTHDTDTDGM